ncbi:hypothetical protein XH88_36090 [Bradyrhizobium sp. CCBAU 51627]|nr:hypothetical protein [Bradyrhizobium sp. CCBAU 51627]
MKQTSLTLRQIASSMRAQIKPMLCGPTIGWQTIKGLLDQIVFFRTRANWLASSREATVNERALTLPKNVGICER